LLVIAALPSSYAEVSPAGLAHYRIVVEKMPNRSAKSRPALLSALTPVESNRPGRTNLSPHQSDIEQTHMSKTHCDISMSLDGFITGPNEGVGNPLGDDNGALHDWMLAAGVDADAEVLAELYETSGAILMGKRVFDVGVEPWGDPPPFGMPVFVVTHEPQEPIPMQGGTTYTFVSTGIEDALEQAKAAAGDKNVAIFGGAGIFQAYLRAGLVDELQIHLVPVLLHRGVRLFDHLDAEPIKLQKTRAIETPSATHLRLAVPS
jgi:dihydrofolate reductase